MAKPIAPQFMHTLLPEALSAAGVGAVVAVGVGVVEVVGAGVVGAEIGEVPNPELLP